VAIGTPYNLEFLPMLKRWVKAARIYNLGVWFRGNWCGWEGWFNYPKISRDEHIEKTRNFIINNFELFKDGDIFTACPECENGGPGDPRINGDLNGYQEFLIKEYQVAQEAFDQIGKQVASNYFSMNGDVARLVMDRNTTAALDGIITIDHYVETPEILIEDVEDIAIESGGKIVLGEIGVPIPDIHGQMEAIEQEQWLDKTLTELADLDIVVGLNYWLNTGGSTGLWDTKGEAKPALIAIRRFFKPKLVYGQVLDELGRGIKQAQISYNGSIVYSGGGGCFELLIPGDTDLSTITVTALGYIKKTVEVGVSPRPLDITLIKEKKDIRFIFEQKLKKWIQPQ
jgi:hypothetical protein